MMFLIGQRGTGKSSVSRALVGTVIDLDEWLAARSGLSPRTLFESLGEPEFRKRERVGLAEVRSLVPAPEVVSLGAGFPLDEIRNLPGEKIWVRRPTDSLGRIFFDRPRLDPDLAPLDEYHQRAREREVSYSQAADWILELPEGQHLCPSVLRRFLQPENGEAWPTQTGIWTLHENDRKRFDWIEKRFPTWGFETFEMRSDLLAEESWKFWSSRLSTNQVLLAYRTKADDLRQSFAPGGSFFDIDWALELGPPPRDRGITSLSLHSEQGDSLSEALIRLQQNQDLLPEAHLKWSPVLESWEELRQALDWQAADPEHRSLLPRSSSGRWKWVRLALKGRQKLNFICETSRSGRQDQPTFLEWLQTPDSTSFAAILGSPVDHSWTPLEQASFFREKKSWPVFRIEIKSDELKEAMPVLEKGGLRAAAVTAPLKILMAEVCENLSERARNLKAVNTIWLTERGWSGDNTDQEGFEKQLVSEGLSEWPGAVVVWGGGGTLTGIRKLFPEAFFLSVRTGRLRETQAALPEGLSSILVIWAAGPRDPCPDGNWRPEVVVDLNYREDSRAREWALQKSARYLSGAGMFHAQAEAQRNFWSKFL